MKETEATLPQVVDVSREAPKADLSKARFQLTLCYRTIYISKVTLSKVRDGDAIWICTDPSNAQDHSAQVEALKGAGCERIYSEEAWGKPTDGRREFEKADAGSIARRHRGCDQTRPPRAV